MNKLAVRAMTTLTTSGAPRARVGDHPNARRTLALTGSVMADRAREDHDRRAWSGFGLKRTFWRSATSGIRIENWHRPLASYMRELLAQGLTLTFFDEPQPRSGDAVRQER
jgi:hypothetical protein